MIPAMKSMLSRYSCQTEQDYINALKEIIQEVALLGLWRAKFFEYAAFYGGTALRVLYGLDRFSEDLDFSLLKTQRNFDLTPYLRAIEVELSSMGFSVRIDPKKKNVDTAIQSAFIKAGTKEHLIKIEVPKAIAERVHRDQFLHIKLEVDTDPPGDFSTEAKTLLLPIPFTVLTFKPADLFAGKIHALLERNWKQRVKGRDYYDFVWYIARGTPLHLEHLEGRLKQSGKWSLSAGWNPQKPFNREVILKLLRKRFAEIDFNAAKKDISPFISDPAALQLWSRNFFNEVAEKLKT